MAESKSYERGQSELKRRISVGFRQLTITRDGNGQETDECHKAAEHHEEVHVEYDADIRWSQELERCGIA
jgi:hypothetical protein